MKQAVILAGGKGTRLRERLGAVPKVLADICGTPLLERQISLVKRHGFTHALLLVGYGSQEITKFIHSRQGWGLEIDCIEDDRPKGTAGATLAALDRLANEFLIMYGDTMLDVNLTDFHAYHLAVPGTAASLFLHPNDHPQDSDLVDVDAEGRILRFHPYPHEKSSYYPNLVSAALYWITRKALEPWRSNKSSLDFGKHLFPAMVKRGMALRGFRSLEYIKDIGTPPRLEQVCADVRSGKVERASLVHPQPVVFIDRDGTINKEIGYVRTAEQFEMLPGVADGIRRLNGSDYRCCVISNQPVIARGECTEEELKRIHNRMETELGQCGAFVDRIYYCPHHPDRGFPGERSDLKIDCVCRKPKTGMIDRAADDLNVSRKRSWLVGDASVDIETGHRAGIRPLLVETGYAGLDRRFCALPYSTVPDLGAAVSFVLDRYPRLITFCTGMAANIREGGIVLVVGLRRSGKSTFASVLREAIEASGKDARLLSLDRCTNDQLRGSIAASAGSDLRRLRELLRPLASPSRPTPVTLPGYDQCTGERSERSQGVQVSEKDIVIIDGAASLALWNEPTAGIIRCFIDIDEASRRTRVVRYCSLQGLSLAEAEQAYVDARQEELDVLASLAGAAERIQLDEI